MSIVLNSSSAHKWGPGGCPANPRMESGRGVSTEKTQKQLDGAAALRAVVTLLYGGDPTTDEGITAEMIDCAQDIVRDVADTCLSAGIPPEVGFLTGYSFAPVSSVAHNNAGSIDVVIIDEPGKRLFLWEYTFGHRYVAAHGNWRLVNAALGVFENIGVSYDGWKIMATIAQPRSYHPSGPIREWTFTGAELSQMHRELEMASTLANAPDAPTVTGDYCRDCSAKLECLAFLQAGFNAIDVSYDATPSILDTEALGTMLTMARTAQKRLGALADGLEEQALARITAGGNVPGWVTEQGKGRERWTVPVDQIMNLGDMFGVKLAKAAEVITPAQARKAGMDAELIDSFVERPAGALSLKPFAAGDVAARFKGISR